MMRGAMEFRILGSLEVIADGVPLRLGGRRQRELLAYLLVHAGMPIATDRIIEDLWGDARPAQAENVFRVLVSRLRAALKPVEIVSTAGAQLDTAGAVLESGELVVRDRTVTQLEDVLGAGAAEVARSEGAELTLDQALDEAAAQASRARVAAPGEP